MIKLTRLNGEQMVLNADLIRSIEGHPDTHVTLTPGEKLVVRESVDEVIRRVVDYQRMLRMIPAGG